MKDFLLPSVMDSSVKYQKFVVTHIHGDDGDKKSAKSDSNSICLIAVVVVLIILTIAVICVAIGVGVGVSLTNRKSELRMGLTANTITQGELQGEYYGTEGGIRFSSTVNATYFVLLITTTSGEQVVYIVHPMASNMTMVGVNDTNFMVMERDQQDSINFDDYVIPRDAMNLMESIMAGNGEMSDNILQKLDNKTVNETRQSTLYNLAMSYEAILIIEAAQALGDLGVMGSEYPSVMRFYQLALRLANSRESESQSDTEDEGDSPAPDTKGYEPRQRRATYCSNVDATCSQCPYKLVQKKKKYRNNCFGLCGYGCNCWSFVCGDCCLHQYCLTHDDCCRRKGFYSWPCLSVAWKVLGSKCTDNYKCW